jgi:hypothetical protein
VEREVLDRLQDFLRRKLNPEIGLAERARMKDMAEIIRTTSRSAVSRSTTRTASARTT